MPRIRSADATITALIAQTSASPATFRGFVTLIDATDGSRVSRAPPRHRDALDWREANHGCKLSTVGVQRVGRNGSAAGLYERQRGSARDSKCDFGFSARCRQ